MIARQRPGSAVVTAMICSGLLTAQLVGGKAARDALFLAQLEVTALPTMIIVASIASIAVVALFSMGTARLTPSKVVPAAFAVSGALIMVEWVLTYTSPKLAAILVYLHVSSIGPVLASGFWLIATEQFDPRTAKQRFAQIAGAGTVGGVVGGVFAERAGVMFGVAAVLPFLAVLNFVGAWGIRSLVRAQGSPAPPPSNPRARKPAQGIAQTGIRALAEIPYIRHLAALVLLGTMSAAFVDYVFKVQAVGAFGRGEGLLRFFAVYYAATSVMTFVVQTSSSQFLLQRFGLALATSMPSLALLAGNAVGLLLPGFSSVTGARGGETIFRGSLFRYGYELFYTPIPAGQKRAVKSIIDVGFDRLGDITGAGIIRLVLLLAPRYHYSTILSLGVASSAAAVIVASRLNRGYIQTLEKSLLNQGLELELSDVEDLTTRTTLLRTLGGRGSKLRLPQPGGGVAAPREESALSGGADPEAQELSRLRSRDRDQIVSVLRREEGLTAALVPLVIPLLAWNPVAGDAAFALRKVAEERVGQLIDALIDPNQDFAVRRRLARVFSVCVSQRAADGLMLGLDDLRFEVRFQCGRSLSTVLETNGTIRIDKEGILKVVLREVAVGRPVWESRRLLDGLDPQEGGSFVDEFVRDRAGQSLAHVFTLLSLVLPREPLQIAFRGLQTADQHLRGTALEYLEGVLPAAVRERLWPFLEDSRPSGPGTRPRDEILADLLRSNQSIMVNLEELQRRDHSRQPDTETGPPIASKVGEP